MTTVQDFQQFIAREKSAIRRQPTKDELKEQVLAVNKHPVLGAPDHPPLGLVGVLTWQKRTRVWSGMILLFLSIWKTVPSGNLLPFPFLSDTPYRFKSILAYLLR